MRAWLIALLVLCLTAPLAGCPDDDDDSATDDDDDDDDTTVGDDDDTTVGDDDDSTPVDGDGDGSPADEDCDDDDAANFPGNTEVCDAQDNDCDPSTWASGEDTDGDGDGALTCLDCDDGDDDFFPGNIEVCDLLDTDCDPATFAAGEDTDGDSDSFVACLDCDDGDADSFPGNPELCDGADNDCEPATVFAGSAADWVVADSTDPGGPTFAPLSLVSPIAIEVADDEASSAMPIGFPFAFAGSTYTELFVGENGWVSFVENEGDGYESIPLGPDDDFNLVIAAWQVDLDAAEGGAIQMETLGAAPDRVLVVDWDSVPSSSGSAGEQVTVQLQLFETSNVIEIHVTQADLTPSSDDPPTVGVEGTPPLARVVYFGDPTATLTAAAIRFTPNEEADQDGDGALACDQDCDDSDATNFPGNAELCDGQDNDCDPTTFADQDGEADTDSDGWVSCADCDDTDATNFPGNAEVCDGQDNDCDGATFAASEDTDGDSDGAVTCLDCDDADPLNFPGNPELCDGQDNDCVGGPGVVTVWSMGPLPTPSAVPDRFRGGLFEAERGARLTALNARLAGGASTVTWMVFEGTDPSDLSTFALLHSNATTSSGSARSSGPIDVPLTAGRWYVLGAHWTLSAQFRMQVPGILPRVAGPLTLTAGVWFNGNTPPGPSDLTANTENYEVGFTAEESEDDGDSDGAPFCVDCDDGDFANSPGGPELCDGLDNDCDPSTAFGAATSDDWRREESPAGLAFAPMPIPSGTATALSLGDDDTSGAIPLGFGFPFAGALRTEVNVSANGWVDFAGQAPPPGYVARLGADDALNEFIAAWWTDLDPSAGGDIAHATLGAAPDRVFVVNYDQVPYHDALNPGVPTLGRVTAQLQLREGTGVIELHITEAAPPPSTSAPGAPVSVGVEGAAPSADAWIDRSRSATVSSHAIRWTPNEETDDDGDGLFYCEGDCGDQDLLVGPTAAEICDGLDNDCDGTATFVDEAVDADADGAPLCLDCLDSEPTAFPGAPERCDGLDNDCRGPVDDYGAFATNLAVNASVGPDPGTTSSAVNFFAGSVVGDLNLRVSIEHTRLEDLEIRLISPAGTVVTVVSGAGGADEDYADTIFDDEGAPLSSGTAPFSDHFVPLQPLAAFDGEPIGGQWRIEVEDLAAGEGGTLHGWSLEVYPEGYGTTPACGPTSCEDMLRADLYAPDGTYFLDTTRAGTAEPYVCDMANGGWTRVYGFDRENDGDDTTFFASSWDTFNHTMGLFADGAGFIRWQDRNSTRDELGGRIAVTVPYARDVRYDLHFEGDSMEGSGVWFGLSAGGVNQDLWCNDDHASDGIYTPAELAGVPYTCVDYVDSPVVDGVFTTSTAAIIDAVFVHSLMADSSGGDDARLYRYTVWVR